MQTVFLAREKKPDLGQREPLSGSPSPPVTIDLSQAAPPAALSHCALTAAMFGRNYCLLSFQPLL